MCSHPSSEAGVCRRSAPRTQHPSWSFDRSHTVSVTGSDCTGRTFQARRIWFFPHAERSSRYRDASGISTLDAGTRHAPRPGKHFGMPSSTATGNGISITAVVFGGSVGRFWSFGSARPKTRSPWLRDSAYFLITSVSSKQSGDIKTADHQRLSRHRANHSVPRIAPAGLRR